MPSVGDVVSRYHDLAALVDTHVARVCQQYAGEIRCAGGCCSCCDRESLAALEAWNIYQYVCAEKPAAGFDGQGCPFLENGLCVVYPVRPLICRSHGVPVQLDGSVHCCGLNFVNVQKVEADMILDQELVDRHLAVYNMAFVQLCDDPFFATGRVLLTDLARRLVCEAQGGCRE